MTPSVYLCGPIDNVTPTGASNWRDRATDLIGDRAEVVDPFREFPEAELAGTPIVVQSGRIAELSNNVLVPASGLHTDIEAAVANALAIVGVGEVPA